MHERHLLDTNILIELAKPTPDEHVMAWLRRLSKPATSAVVCYEIARGIERMARSKRRTYLENWFADLLGTIETLPVDEATGLAAARMETAANKAGKSVDVRDLLIASTAQTHGCCIATQNVSDFAGLGVFVYDPFTDQRSM